MLPFDSQRDKFYFVPQTQRCEMWMESPEREREREVRRLVRVLVGECDSSKVICFVILSWRHLHLLLSEGIGGSWLLVFDFIRKKKTHQVIKSPHASIHSTLMLSAEHRRKRRGLFLSLSPTFLRSCILCIYYYYYYYYSEYFMPFMPPYTCKSSYVVLPSYLLI